MILGDGRQPQAEHGASIGGVGRLHGSAVLERDLADDREPEAAALSLARVGAPEEPVEHVRKVRRVDAGAVVAHLDASVVDDHLYDPADRGMMRRVVEQVLDRAGQTLRDPVDDRRLERALESDVGEVAARARHAIGDDAIETHVLGLR